MFCPYCGKEINDNANFCPYCGKELTDTLSDENLQKMKEKHSTDIRKQPRPAWLNAVNVIAVLLSIQVVSEVIIGIYCWIYSNSLLVRFYGMNVLFMGIDSVPQEEWGLYTLAGVLFQMTRILPFLVAALLAVVIANIFGIHWDICPFGRKKLKEMQVEHEIKNNIIISRNSRTIAVFMIVVTFHYFLAFGSEGGSYGIIALVYLILLDYFANKNIKKYKQLS